MCVNDSFNDEKPAAAVSREILSLFYKYKFPEPSPLEKNGYCLPKNPFDVRDPKKEFLKEAYKKVFKFKYSYLASQLRTFTATDLSNF